MTGILNRLEEGGWVTRDRAENDRRAVVIAKTPDRQRELYGIFGEMNTRMKQICDRYTDEELAVIVDFLSRTAAAGRVCPARSVERTAGSARPPGLVGVNAGAVSAS